MYQSKVIDHYLRLIAGDGLSDVDLLIAAKQLQAAVRQEQAIEQEEVETEKTA